MKFNGEEGLSTFFRGWRNVGLLAGLPKVKFFGSCRLTHDHFMAGLERSLWPCDYEDRLWEEKVIFYVSAIEGLFCRLSERVPGEGCDMNTSQFPTVFSRETHYL